MLFIALCIIISTWTPKRTKEQITLSKLNHWAVKRIGSGVHFEPPRLLVLFLGFAAGADIRRHEDTSDHTPRRGIGATSPAFISLNFCFSSVGVSRYWSSPSLQRIRSRTCRSPPMSQSPLSITIWGHREPAVRTPEPPRDWACGEKKWPTWALG